ncbi:MAG: SDR family oxidoreductase [Deltaproteobacteria bacterium]|nr:SDR family oxidoreductase [Deltaproteobacteria bacterium]
MTPDGWREIVGASRRTWLVTGGAGFIGSHLVAALLSAGQRVRCLDNFATGRRENLEEVTAGAGEAFELVEGDIRDPATCAGACRGVDLVLHQAALGSVPRSIQDPITSHEVNVTGFLQVLRAAHQAGVRRVVYASSSSVYGDHPVLPKVEDQVGRQLSPYAASKFADEVYAHAFAASYGLELVGLRYFNVFGPRQDPSGPYAAVIPLWFQALLTGAPAHINGDGLTSRDFCYVDNVVQVNLRAATIPATGASNRVYNVACGERTTLRDLFELIRGHVAAVRPAAAAVEPVAREFRAGDVRHSLADISLARKQLGYAPSHTVRQGMAETARWYVNRAGR